jgi:WD40 repeat protein
VGTNVLITDQGQNPEFLKGHEGRISCLAVSSDGRYIASGEETRTGFSV